MQDAYLNVQNSILGRKWQDRLYGQTSQEASTMVCALGIEEALARIMAGRGITYSQAKNFLNPKLRDSLPEPFTLVDMEKATSRLVEAIETREKIAIFGDYDVDGACSSALIADYLQTMGCKTCIHIPDRIKEGYGPNITAISAFINEGIKLLICVDCGTSAHEVFIEAQKLGEEKKIGMEIIVLDHHQAPEKLPEILALVNPNRMDDLSGLGYLCAAGVVFIVLVALNRALREKGETSLPDLLSFLDLVALATVADVVPLTGLNRVYVAQGLKIMHNRERIGLAALADVARLESEPAAWHLGFLLGPRINAGGRIGDSALGAKLLLSNDKNEAKRIAEQLDKLNRERQTIEEEILRQAEEKALSQIDENDKKSSIIVADKNWHPGIIGIIAGRLKERFNLPSFAFAQNENGEWVGSGRSITGVDLGETVRAAVENKIAIKGGGHGMAAGISIIQENLSKFIEFLEENLENDVKKAHNSYALLIDMVISTQSLNLKFIEDIYKAAPFGQGNPEPVFVLPNHKLSKILEIKGGHLKITIASQDGSRCEIMAFRASGKPIGEALIQNIGNNLHFAINASRDIWNGREKISLRLIDAAISE